MIGPFNGLDEPLECDQGRMPSGQFGGCLVAVRRDRV
jgi:hypothetical protein